MSIPVRFEAYDSEGKFLRTFSCFTISYGQDSSNVSLLSRRLSEATIEDHQKYVDPSIRYAVPTQATDYMFDLLDTKTILPNKFKNHSTTGTDNV